MSNIDNFTWFISHLPVNHKPWNSKQSELIHPVSLLFYQYTSTIWWQKSKLQTYK